MIVIFWLILAGLIVSLNYLNTRCRFLGVPLNSLAPNEKHRCARWCCAAGIWANQTVWVSQGSVCVSSNASGSRVAFDIDRNSGVALGRHNPCASTRLQRSMGGHAGSMEC